MPIASMWAGRMLGGLIYSLAVIVSAGLATIAQAAGELVAASPLGEKGDRINGAAILTDGSLVVGGIVSTGPAVEKAKELVPGKGVLVKLSPDGRRVSQAARVGSAVRDLAVDAQDNLYAATNEGVLKLDKDLSKVLWQVKTPKAAVRVDVGPKGTAVALIPEKDDRNAPGTGQVVVLSPDGKELGRFNGHNNTLDVCIHEPSQTVVLIGWRQARAWDGKRTEPVQIAYMRGYGFEGKVRWSNYGWSVDRDSPQFLNRPENNMADTRGYRCCIGPDGKLYAAFECAGGNHIFRYEPRLDDKQQWVSATSKRPRGDDYHEFHNSRSEHKLFVACYDPVTGNYERGQQFCGRLQSGRANAVRVVDGAIAADAAGRVMVAGTAAAGLPLDLLPANTGDYTGGNYLLVMRSDFQKRQWCTRIQSGGQTHALAVRQIDGKTHILVGGGADAGKAGPFPETNALQPDAEPGTAFFALIRID